MPLKNTHVKFGWVTQFLHWSIFLLFCVQFFLVNRREYFPDDAPEKLQYILLHKSLGITLFGLALVMLIWRHVGVRPHSLNTSMWQKILSQVVHLLLYVVMLVMPLTGIGMSLLSGYGLSYFGWPVPNPFAANQGLSKFFHEAHHWIAVSILVLVALHTIAAFYHHFIKKDNVLKRMLPFG